MSRALLILVVMLVLVAGGWLIYTQGISDDNSSSGSTSSQTPSSNNTAQKAGAITIKNSMFTPSQISVQKGDTVTWTNDDTTTHTVTDDLSNVDGPSSGDIQPGSTYSFTFNKTGSFQYHCTHHPSMRGTIVVK